MRELLISNHFSIITDVPDLKRNSIKTSHTVTFSSSFFTRLPSNTKTLLFCRSINFSSSRMRRLHSDANLLTHTIRKGCNCRSVSLRQPQPFLIHHSLLLVFDQFLSIAISSEIDTSVVFSVPSEYVITV